MNTTEYIKYIQREIKNKSYKEYVHVFYEYKEYLENLIKENPKHVEAVCQLATVYFELRYEISASTNIMEELLLHSKGEINATDQVRIYTNLAFFYEESGNQVIRTTT